MSEHWKEVDHGITGRVLAERYNVSFQTISKIIRRERWAHV